MFKLRLLAKTQYQLGRINVAEEGRYLVRVQFNMSTLRGGRFALSQITRAKLDNRGQRKWLFSEAEVCLGWFKGLEEYRFYPYCPEEQ